MKQNQKLQMLKLKKNGNKKMITNLLTILVQKLEKETLKQNLIDLLIYIQDLSYQKVKLLTSKNYMLPLP